MADDDYREVLRQELAPIKERLNGIETRLDKIEIRTQGLPLIGEAISILQRDSRLIRAAVNDIGKTNITAGEVEAMHEDIDRLLAKQRELEARLAAIEQR
jgi:hypothetical protein